MLGKLLLIGGLVLLGTFVIAFVVSFIFFYLKARKEQKAETTSRNSQEGKNSKSQ